MGHGMTRISFFFKCESHQCAATMDLPPKGVGTRETGLLIVTGGNELRSGPHGSQAAVAAHFAEKGFAIFRYDRRGVGDSRGTNTGWRGAEADIKAAAQAFRVACPDMKRIIGFGNCDAASSLASYAQTAAISRVLLANPWVFDHDGESAQATEQTPKKPEHNRASALRYYRRRLGDPVSLLRDLFGGKVDLGHAIGDIASVSKAAESTKTAATLANVLNAWGNNATILLAKDDRTALYFQDQMAALGEPMKGAQICPTASHSFADDAAQQWLYRHIEAALTAP
jgi:exosortase A-associated hydrolase 1